MRSVASEEPLVDMSPPDQARVRQAYDAWHGELEVDAGATAPWHDMIRRHSRFVGDMAGKRVLEIGCGRGGFALWMRGQEYRPKVLCAADISIVAVTKGRRVGLRSNVGTVQWGIADISRLPFADSSFDTVISCETIEHVGSPRHALGQLARVLRPGGRLYLTAPNYFNLLLLYRGYLQLRGRKFSEAGQEVNKPLLLPVMCRWLRRLGLRVVAVEGTRHMLPLWPGRSAAELRFLERLPIVTKWFASQVLVVAEKARIG